MVSILQNEKLSAQTNCHLLSQTGLQNKDTKA